MSENIFTELYNKILGLFGQTAPKEESTSIEGKLDRIIELLEELLKKK